MNIVFDGVLLRVTKVKKKTEDFSDCYSCKC